MRMGHFFAACTASSRKRGRYNHNAPSCVAIAKTVCFDHVTTGCTTYDRVLIESRTNILLLALQITSKPANCHPCAPPCCWDVCAWCTGVAFSSSQVADASNRPDVSWRALIQSDSLKPSSWRRFTDIAMGEIICSHKYGVDTSLNVPPDNPRQINILSLWNLLQYILSFRMCSHHRNLSYNWHGRTPLESDYLFSSIPSQSISSWNLL